MGQRGGGCKERLMATIQPNLERSTQEICDHILHNIQEFHGGVPQVGDIILLVMRSVTNR